MTVEKFLPGDLVSLKPCHYFKKDKSISSVDDEDKRSSDSVGVIIQKLPINDDDPDYDQVIDPCNMLNIHVFWLTASSFDSTAYGIIKHTVNWVCENELKLLV